MTPTDAGPDHSARSLLREAVEELRCNYAIFDRGRRLVDFSASYAHLHSLSPDVTRFVISYDGLMQAAVERTLGDATPQDKAAEVTRRIAAHEADDPGEFDRLYPGGRWMRVSKRRLPGGYVAGLAIDITSLKEREIAIAASEARYRALIDTAPVGIWHLDERGHTLLANARLDTLFGGTTPVSLTALQRKAVSSLDGPFGFPCGREVEAEIPTQDGRSNTHVLVCASEWLVASDGSRSTILTLLDISPLKAAQSQVEHLARHDALTGLGNRISFQQGLNELAANQDAAVLVMVDLDRFKEVNDVHGHEAGDALLRAVAVRLQMASTASDLPCRLGGDEFAILVRGPHAVRRGPLLAEALARTLSEALVTNGVVIPTAASIGHAAFPEDADDIANLQRAADLALYAAKREGRSRSVPFRRALLDGVRHRSRVAAAFEAAMAGNELKLLWQPQFTIPDRSTRGAEARVCWPVQPGLHRAPMPADVLSIIAEAGLLQALDSWVLDAAVAQLASWSAVPGAPEIAAVKVSSASLSDATLPARVATALVRYRVAAESLEIELPEDVAVANLAAITPVLRDLRALGVRLALDGFGRSAASVAHLVEWEIELLKLSPAIVAGLSGPENRSVAQAVVALGNALGIPVMADGVETGAHVFSLRRVGCRLMQGDYLSRPMLADELVPHLVLNDTSTGP